MTATATQSTSDVESPRLRGGRRKRFRFHFNQASYPRLQPKMRSCLWLMLPEKSDATAIGDRTRRLQTSAAWINVTQLGSFYESAIQHLNRYLRGWMNYFGVSQHYRPIEELDDWLRRRIRVCYGKRWRRPRIRIANLLKLGKTKRQAISTGISRKGYWRLSKTLATHTGMTNEWLEQQGLLSIQTLWMNVQGYA